jgi:predicted Fe-Mo cluster-binding NifX family protein
MEKIRKIAVPVLNNKFAEKFETTTSFKIYYTVMNAILKTRFINLNDTDPEKAVRTLKESGVTELITKDIEHSTIEVLNKMKINVFVGVEEKNPDDLIIEHLEGRLITNGRNIKA